MVPISICAILPISIVLIVFIASMYTEKRRAEVLIKAIESNNGIDADKLAEAFGKPKKTARENLNTRLLLGCIFSFVGIVFCVLGVISILSNGGFESSTGSNFMPLIIGGCSLAIGLSFLVVYFVTRKQVKD